MRGTRRQRAADGGHDRFIPAHAGNTPPRWPRRTVRPVHPRACGEHVFSLPLPETSPGSSPRMRGTRAPATADALQKRFIPAHAGNTPPRSATPGAQAAHPRACGEHSRARWSSRRIRGSSPRMRGTRGRSFAATPTARFIPAHAGNTPAHSTRRIFRAVHPRACGEHFGSVTPKISLIGSSPRMRGTPAAHRPHCSRVRFIPAHAGNTSAART